CYPDLCEELHAGTGIDPEYRQCGMLFLDCPEDTDIRSWVDANSDACSWIPAGKQMDLSRRWFPRSTPSLWVPGIAQARNPRLLRALREMLISLSVRIIEHCPVYRIDFRNVNQSVTCLTHVEEIEAGHVIICAGVWSNDLLPDSHKLDLVPMRGQMLCVTDHDVDLDHMVINDDCYLVPRQSEALLIGSTVENVGFDNGVTETARQHFLKAASRLLPALGGNETVYHWSGLRPKSSDGRPYIGSIDGMERVMVNTGHYRTGLLTAVASARIVSDTILQHDCEFDRSVYQPVWQ
ncbi:MAG: FAD-dependent oxidoreductase, partial [Thiotrichales bacterium]|nr:FAD-dependent oxidoreductase [Thiotrichales bacterium]